MTSDWACAPPQRPACGRPGRPFLCKRLCVPVAPGGRPSPPPPPLACLAAPLTYFVSVRPPSNPTHISAVTELETPDPPSATAVMPSPVELEACSTDDIIVSLDDITVEAKCVLNTSPLKFYTSLLFTESQ